MPHTYFTLLFGNKIKHNNHFNILLIVLSLSQMVDYVLIIFQFILKYFFKFIQTD